MKQSKLRKVLKFLLCTVLTVMICANVFYMAYSVYANQGREDPTAQTGKVEEKPIVTEVEFPPVPTPVPTPAETPPPATQRAYAKADGLRAVAGTLEKGDVVDITGSYQGLYSTIRDSFGNTYYVESSGVRTDDPSTWDQESEWTAQDGYIGVAVANIYDNAQLLGNPINRVAKRSRVHVIEKTLNALYIEVTETSVPERGAKGYISIDDFTTELPALIGGGYYGGGGGDSGGGGGDSGGGGGGGESYGADVNISDLAFVIPRQTEPRIVSIASIRGFEADPVITGTKGYVYTDGLELIVAFYQKGEAVDLIAKDNDVYWTVLAGKKICTIPAGSVRLEGEPEEEPWEEQDGYIAVTVANIYDNASLSGNPIRQVAKRSSVHVYEKDGDALYIEVTETSVPEHGAKGYISADDFTTERPVLTGGYYYGGDGGGGDSGGGGGDSGGGGGGTPDWSEPVL